MPTKLYIGNVPSAISSTELKELFEKYGKVLECDIVKDYAFVHMEDSSKAKASIAALNDFNLKGNRIRVEISTTQLRNPPRSSRRAESPPSRYESSSSRSSRHRDYPMISSSSSSRNGTGGPDRSYPSMRSSHVDHRSRPYDSPYDRHRLPPPPPPPPPMSYSDSYSRDDHYHHRGPSTMISDHYGRGPSMRSSYDSYPSGSHSVGSSRNRHAASPPSSRHGGSSRYGSPGRSSSSSRRPTRRSSPAPPPSSSSSRSRR